MESIKTKFRRLGYRIKRWFNQDRMVFLVAIAMCLIWTWGAISAMSRNWELEQRLVARRQELTLLQLEIDSLELENRYYASEEYQEERKALAQALLRKLTEHQRFVVIECVVRGRQHKDVAKQLGTSRQTVTDAR